MDFFWNDKTYSKFFLACNRKEVYINNNLKFKWSNIIIVSINFDLMKKLLLKNLIKLSNEIAKRLKQELIVIETATRTTDKIIFNF